MAQTLTVLGTASDVGKSIVATALCRIFHQAGLRVAPFKAQNMSNNSFVSLSQGELARAQAVQAEAARVEPTVDMNPVLLKPSADLVSQVIVQGKVAGNRSAADYFADTSRLRRLAFESLDRLRAQYDLVVIEGAGSCAEVNLRSRDFTNFDPAHHADGSAVLVADIDRGGVFAQVIGTLEVLDRRDRSRLRGIIVNRFRGDPRLFDEGLGYLESRTGLPVLGLIPHFSDIQIDSEDGLPGTAIIDPPAASAEPGARVAVILLPHISNFTDFAPLDPHYLRRPRSLDGYELVLIPGSKNTRGDLAWLHESGWSELLCAHAARGGRLGGICGGYQMLGRVVRDPLGIEGPAGETGGLGLLPVDTTLERGKRLHRTSALWAPLDAPVAGYEIHHGVTVRDASCRPLLRITSRDGVSARDEDGAVSNDGRVWGCYLHGLFDEPALRQALLGFRADAETAYDFRQRQYDRLAEHFRRHLDMAKITALVRGPD